MTEKRAQIAFAPVDDGFIELPMIRFTERDAQNAIGKIYDGGWPDAEEDGWRIRKVKIEVVDD